MPRRSTAPFSSEKGAVLLFSEGPTPFTALEAKSDLPLQRPQGLRAGDGAGTCGLRGQPRRDQRAVRVVLGVPERNWIRRVVVLQLRRPCVEHDGIEHVERIEADLHLP